MGVFPMRQLTLLALYALLSAPSICGQQPATLTACENAGQRPAFDVVSVKRSNTPPTNTSMNLTRDGMLYTGTLQQLVLIAFNLHGYQVSGGPDWFTTSRWDIRAKNVVPNPPSANLSEKQRQELSEKDMQEIQSILIDQFHFRCHMSFKESPMYDLVLANGGSKLKETTAGGGDRGSISTDSNGAIKHASGTGVGIGRLATFLGRPAGRLVVDKTGLTGSYDFRLDWVDDLDDPDSRKITGPNIFAAVEEQLGLRLRSAKGSVPVMVVDQVELPED